LIDHFGVAEVSVAFKTLDIEKDDLLDPTVYLDIYNYLNIK